MNIEFKSKSILVTGGTRGIGLATALEFLKSGAEKVVITGTGQTFNFPKELEAFSNVYYERVDFFSENISSDIEEIVKKHQGFDVCVNNAGINIISDIENLELEDIEKVLRVNLIAPAIVMSKCCVSMKKKGYGRFVNVSSIFGEVSKEMRFMYSSSKSGLIGQTKSVSLDLAPFGILVNAVGPGFIGTDLTKQILGDKGIEEMSGQVPLKRLGEPEEIAKVILFLGSEQNSFITGQHIIADGGFLAK